MLRWPERTEAAPRWKNGHPAQSTTGNASAAWIAADRPGGTRPEGGMPMPSQSTGTVRTRPTVNRRVMSASSWFGAASAETETGSSAMPQIGQLPGPSCRISGCIGQVCRPAVGVAAGGSCGAR